MSRRPNLLLITTDQQRFDTVGPRKPRFLRMPHLEHLAAGGISFTAAYADCPICVPGRAALMTGRSCYRHGMATNAPTCDYFDEAETLASVVAAAGYDTCCVGKAHFHPQRKRHGFHRTIPLDDYYRAMARSGSPLQPRRHGLGENELVATMATVPESLTLTSWITERAAEWLEHERDPDKPWFLWVSYTKPHPPLDPCEPYYSMYRRSPIPEPWDDEWDEERLPAGLRRRRASYAIDEVGEEQVREARAAYYGLVTQIDFNIGRLWAAIQDTGPFFSGRDDTLAIFASDHGDHLGDHGLNAKSDPLEGSWHIPLLMRLPSTWPASERMMGTTCERVTCLQDVSATIATAAGAELPASWDGIDLIAQARGVAGRERLLGGAGFNRERPDAIEWSAIVDGRWKYVWWYAGGREQLFDLAEDPTERIDLAGDPALAERLAEQRAALVAGLRAVAPRYLDGDRPLARDEPPFDARSARAAGFPGHMRDAHPSDALH